MKLRKTIAAALCALLCTSACASAPAPIRPPKQVRPGMWKLYDADTTIYLFGTIHVLPKGYPWRTKAFNAAAMRANELVLEVADLEDQTKTAQTFMKLAISPGLKPVLDRVSAEKRPALSRLIDKSGMSAETLNKFESWAVAITVAASTLRDLNVSPDYGVERILTKQFRAARKPVAGLETSEFQLGLFDALSPGAQETFLEGMADESVSPAKEYGDMLASWSKGDDKTIALSFDDEVKLSPELTEVLLRKRNRNWTDWLAKRLTKPGVVLVAVGAGHLAGPDSVQALLSARGLKVVRVQ